MANQHSKTAKEKSLKGLRHLAITGTKGSVYPKKSTGLLLMKNSSAIPSVQPKSLSHYDNFNNSGKSTFDRKAEEMKAFLKRNPVPKEFLN